MTAGAVRTSASRGGRVLSKKIITNVLTCAMNTCDECRAAEYYRLHNQECCQQVVVERRNITKRLLPAGLPINAGCARLLATYRKYQGECRVVNVAPRPGELPYASHGTHFHDAISHQKLHRSSTHGIPRKITSSYNRCLHMHAGNGQRNKPYYQVINTCMAT